MSPYEEAQSRYQGYRDAAYDATWRCMLPLLQSIDLKIFPLGRHALAYWSAIKNFESIDPGQGFLPGGGFPWDKIYRQFRSTPRRFDIALWDGDKLCGLAIGNASRGKRYVTIKWIERFATTDQPGWVATTVLTAADYFGKTIGSEEVRLRNPRPDTERLYAAHGFALAEQLHGATYWARPIS
ncbi:hypothetical protein [Aquibaculum sediminis]|uniref:hypothetical protein n=1 Tax=Aquibaculum sediminis TaxID=3231907 RepID=UPI003452B0E1